MMTDLLMHPKSLLRYLAIRLLRPRDSRAKERYALSAPVAHGYAGARKHNHPGVQPGVHGLGQHCVCACVCVRMHVWRMYVRLRGDCFRGHALRLVLTLTFHMHVSLDVILGM